MYCSKCGAQNDNQATFCTKCGQQFAQPTPQAQQAAPPVPPKKKNKGCLIAVLVVLGIFVLGGLGIGIIAVLTSGISSAPEPVMSKDAFVNSSSEMEYDLFARQPDENKGKTIWFTGEIVQTVGEGTIEMRVALRKPTDPTTDLDRVVYVTYKMPDGAPRLLEGDIIKVYGISAGLETYAALLGNEVKLPKVKGAYIDVLSQIEPGATAAAIVQTNMGTLGEYDIKILDATKGTSYDDKPVIIVSYEWKNNGSEAASFSSAFNATAYQNGVQLDSGYMSSDSSVDYEATYNKIQPGTTQTVYCAYEASSTSDVMVEVTSALSFDDKVKVTKTVSPQ